MSKQFEGVDWEHLDLATKNKANMCKIWRSKQNSGFCRMQAQAGVYSGESFPNEQCPNCGAREMNATSCYAPTKINPVS